MSVGKVRVEQSLTVHQFPVDSGLPPAVRAALARLPDGMAILKRLAAINQQIQLSAGANVALLSKNVRKKCKPGEKGALCQLEQLLALYVARRGVQLARAAVPIVVQQLAQLPTSTLSTKAQLARMGIGRRAM